MTEKQDEEMKRFLKSREHAESVKEFIETVTRDSFIVCMRVSPNNDYDFITVNSTGEFELEVAMNRNSISIPYKTNGYHIFIQLEKAWVELTVSNFFATICAYLLMNWAKMCCPD